MNSWRSSLRMLVLAAALAAGCSTGCREDEAHKAQARQRQIDAIAQEYVAVVLALGERDADSLDFAVVPGYLRSRVHAEYPTLDAISAQAENLRTEAQALWPHDLLQPPGKEVDRAAFLVEQLDAVAARAEMLRGHQLPFDQEALALFHEPVLPNRSASERAMIRAQVSSLLPPGKSEADRYAAYDQRFLIPPPRLRAVMEAAIDACRQATAPHITLPAGESIDLKFVRNQPWGAFSRYHGNAHSTISINLDFPLTVDAALELACHEGYPGHHVFNTLRDEALAKQRGWPEARVQPTFSPQSYVSEAAAAFAPRLAFTPADRIRIERDVLFPLAGLPPAEAERYVRICDLMRGLATAEPAIAREYLDGRLEFVRAEEALQSEVLMTHAEALLLYLNEYRSYMLAYTDGPERIRALVKLTDDPASRTDAWKRYEALMTHLVATL